MLLPLALIFFALLAAAVVAYGTEPIWASFGPHGLDLILWSRRLEWPLIATTILLCGGLLLVVISAKRRIWWLIALLPILALFYHRFTAGPARGLSTVADPPFVAAEKLPSLSPNALIVGLIFNGQPVAFPCSELFRAPVVIRTGREKPVVLFWSAFANRALAFTTDRDVKAEDLEIISSPGNALVVYNTRLGQFINGLTGKTFKGETPTGFHESLQIVKTTWQRWKSEHPDTQVMSITPVDGAFNKAVLPRHKMPGVDLADIRTICVVATTQPIAVPSDLVTEKPLNLTIGKTALMLVRVNGIVRAFNRELPGDLVPRFFTFADPKHPAVFWSDTDTGSEWNSKGEWVAGTRDLHGTTLSPILVEDDLYWNVMKFWYPDLHLATAAEVATAIATPPVKRMDRPPPPRRPRGRQP
jgi:hypothetical protein